MALDAIHVPLDRLTGWWLIASCCGATRCYPCPMVARYGTPQKAVSRFRCIRCGRRQTRIILTDRADAGGVGGPTVYTRIEVNAIDEAEPPPAPPQSSG